MLRQERRFKLREVEKKIKKIEKMSEFKATKDFFNTLKEEDYKLLSDGTHPDQKLTAFFKRYQGNMKYLVALTQERELLLALSPITPNDRGLRDK